MIIEKRKKIRSPEATDFKSKFMSKFLGNGWDNHGFEKNPYNENGNDDPDQIDLECAVIPSIYVYAYALVFGVSMFAVGNYILTG